MRHLCPALLIAACVSAGDALGPYQDLIPSVPGGIAAATVDPKTVPDDTFIAVDAQGRLTLSGRRMRFWGVIGSIPNQSKGSTDELRGLAPRRYSDNEAMVNRLQDLGFNLQRLWGTTVVDYTPGDGSVGDVLDHYVATAKAKGFRFWLAGMNPGVGEPTAADVDILDDPTTAEAWRAAVAEALKDPNTREMKSLLNSARAWDPRLEAIAIRNATRILTRTNRYTGLRWCDDPVFVSFELSNEEWYIRRMLQGSWQKLPSFFRNSLLANWNTWLRQRYDSQDRLLAAWGALRPGEDLGNGSVAFAPMAGPTRTVLSINDASAHAQAAATDGSTEIDPQSLPEARGRDVLAFLMAQHVAHKRTEAAAIKPLGRATRAAPLAFDTGIGYEIQSAWLHQNAGVTVHDAYVNGHYGTPTKPAGPFDDALLEQQKILEYERKAPNRGKWTSWLEKPPGISQGVPWLEHNKHPNMPYFCYETQIQQPAKYRADFPLRLAALASIQDWDIACWHYWGAVADISSYPRPFNRPMDVTTGGHPQGYHYTFDEVQNAMMCAAGLAWRASAWQPAPQPTTFIYGRRAMTDPLSMRYAGSYGATGMDMLPTTYQHGVRLVIDPSREDNEIRGPVVKAADYSSHNPYTPTAQITFDYKLGYLRLDAPAAKVWTGFLGKIGGRIDFTDGVSLSDVGFANPPGIYETMTSEEGYLAFAMYSHDGAPLATAKRVSLSLVSTSFNTGFSLGVDNPDGKTRQGTLPVLVARVSGTVSAPALDGMRFTLRDWHLLPLATGTVQGGRLRIPNDLPVFVVELER